MGELKTRPSAASVEKFLAGVTDPERKKDCRTLLGIMKRVTGRKPRMWGPSIVGFGSYHYRYASGREGDWFLTGFSPRKGDLILYLMPGVRNYPALLKKLGRYQAGTSCLYLKNLAGVDLAVLEKLIAGAHRDILRMSKPRSA